MKRFVIATLIGIITGCVILSWMAYPVYSFEYNYDCVVWQEIDVPNPDLGSEGNGYEGEQDFFWDEIVSTRSYKIEVLEKLGRPLGPIKYMGDILPTPIFDCRSRLKIGIRVDYTTQQVTDESLGKYGDEINAFADVFIRRIQERGIPAQKIGVPTTETVTYRLKDFLMNFGPKVFLGTLASSWLVLLFLRKPSANKAEVLTDEAAPHP